MDKNYYAGSDEQWVDKEKIISQHFFKTGVAGAYETADVDDELEQDGKYIPCFDDALVIVDTQQTLIKLKMYIEGRRYNICSVFPTVTRHTPTDKMLTLIDAELKNNSRNI